MGLRKLYFGTAGIPISTPKRDVIAGINQVKDLGLDAMELEFVRRVSLSAERALEVRKVAKRAGVKLTCHGEYYINLNSPDEAKRKRSIERILNAAKIAYIAGAWSVCFHAAYYMGDDPKIVYDRVKEALKEVIRKLDNQGIKIWIRPETTGKPTQFGSLEEVLRLSQELEMVMPVIDYAHLRARNAGGFNSYDEFARVLELVEEYLGKEGLRNMHIHVSGIEYTEKGEKRHLNIEETDLDYEALVKSWRDFKIKGVVISESPNIEGDAILLRNTYRRLGRKARSKKREK